MTCARTGNIVAACMRLHATCSQRRFPNCVRIEKIFTARIHHVGVLEPARQMWRVCKWSLDVPSLGVRVLPGGTAFLEMNLAPGVAAGVCKALGTWTYPRGDFTEFQADSRNTSSCPGSWL